MQSSRSLAEFIEATELPASIDTAALYSQIRNGISRADDAYNKRYAEKLKNSSS